MNDKPTLLDVGFLTDEGIVIEYVYRVPIREWVDMEFIQSDQTPPMVAKVAGPTRSGR